MASTNYAANPSRITIAKSESATAYHNAVATWESPGEAYNISSIKVAFTTANSGYYVYVYHNVDGSASSLGTYSSSAESGEKFITLPDRSWQGMDGNTITMRFRRPASNSQEYTNIRVVVTYESVAEPSTIVVAAAIAGEPQTVNITNTNETVKHTVTWTYGSVTSGAQSYGAATRSPAWAVPESSLSTLYADNPSSSTISGEVSVVTLTEDDVTIGTTQADAALTIPQNEDTLPQLSVTMTKTQDEQGSAAGVDYLQNHTTLHITPVADGQLGAGITTLRIQTPDADIATTSGYTSDILIRTGGTYTVLVTAVDTRGFQTEWSVTLNVVSSSAPLFTNLTAVRCDSAGNENDEGAYILITAAATSWSGSGSVSYTYKIANSGSSATIETGELQNGTGIVGSTLDREQAYTVSVIATDDLGQSSMASVDVGSALYTIHRMAGGYGVAFGKTAELFGVEVRNDWPFRTHGQEILELTVDIAHPEGSVIQTLSADFNPNTLWPWTTWALYETQAGTLTMYVWARVARVNASEGAAETSGILGRGLLGAMALGRG